MLNHNGLTVHFHGRDSSYVFFRYNDSERVIVAVNISNGPEKADWTMNGDGNTDEEDVCSSNVTPGDDHQAGCDGVSFSHQSAFGKSFKKLTGRSPFEQRDVMRE